MSSFLTDLVTLHELDHTVTEGDCSVSIKNPTLWKDLAEEIRLQNIRLIFDFPSKNSLSWTGYYHSYSCF